MIKKYTLETSFEPQNGILSTHLNAKWNLATAVSFTKKVLSCKLQVQKHIVCNKQTVVQRCKRTIGFAIERRDRPVKRPDLDMVALVSFCVGEIECT